MARPSLSQLRVFVCVAEQGSFSGAAAETGMSQSSLSEAVRSLEKALGTPLFQRQPQGIRLTEAGETVLEHALRTVQAADDLEGSLLGGALRGELRLAAYRSMGTYLLPPVLARFRQLHPEVSIRVITVGSDTQARHLIQRGEADAVLGALPLIGPFLSWPLLHDPYVVLAPAGRGPHVFVLSELTDTPLLLPPPGDSCCLNVLQYLQAQQIRLHSVQHIDEDSVVAGMVQHGLGISITAVLAAQPLLPGVQVLPLPDPLERTLGLSVLATRASLPLIRAFVEVARETTNRTFQLPSGQLYPAV
ncbi:LysR family transcriptional regulator [Deinococcus sp.]|uniref:LysR family transcriptional regulator n=1 Tax=Deinococcus sp. TaxID=47478 RepID=UPI003B592F96